jgi:hypothetical protein
MGNHVKDGKIQKCNKEAFLDVSFISAVYKARLVHNLIAVLKFTCSQAYSVTGGYWFQGGY